MTGSSNHYRYKPADQINFRCPACKHEWQGAPGRIEDAAERSHPFAYFADCEICRTESPQVAWEIGMMSRWAKASGPKTDAGKAKSAANLDGHPTPEEALRTRFNAMKHGLSARQAKFFPAKPDKYPHCKTCDIDHFTCSQQPACLKRTELFMKHHMAFDLQDPDMLRENQADLQAGVSAIIEDMLLALISDGVTIQEPQGGFDKDGGFNLARYLDEASGEWVTLHTLKAHPLLKPFSEFLSRNNLTLADLNMTPKVKADQEIQMGHLDKEDTNRESLLEYQRQQTEKLDQIKGLVYRAKQKVESDPVYIEHLKEDSEQQDG